MKGITFFACFFILLNSLFAQLGEQERIIDSKVERVTVFLQGAQITRTAEVSLPASTTTLVFTDLSASLDPSTVQVKADGDLTILSVNHRRNFAKEIEQPLHFKALKDEIVVIQDSLKSVDYKKSSLKRHIRFLTM